MKNLFNQTDKKEIIDRINTLAPDAQRLWGKMDVAQMLAHTHAALQTPAGQAAPPRIFIGRLIAPLIKARFLSEAPFGKNSPTDKSFLMTGTHDFQYEKKRVSELIEQFSQSGPEKCSTHPHPFFGKLTAEQWGIAMYKHFDHHLRQFGA